MTETEIQRLDRQIALLERIVEMLEHRDQLTAAQQAQLQADLETRKNSTRETVKNFKPKK